MNRSPRRRSRAASGPPPRKAQSGPSSRLNGVRTLTVAATQPTTTLRATGTPGRTEIKLRFLNAAGTVIATAGAKGTWLLPSSAAMPIRPNRRDRLLDARLAAVANTFSGYSAIVVDHLSSGRGGSWNPDARFPAASTVKLGVLVATLRRSGPAPGSLTAWYDLEQLAGWSSNLAANRLFTQLGVGSSERSRTVVEATLRQLGATSSTYPGIYRVGTAHMQGPAQPPLVSQRTTTAHDLAAVLTTINGAALGDALSLARSGLSAHQARLALALLLNSQPVADNVGLFHAALPAGMPAAQKQGWLSDAFHTAAVLYTRSGPVVCVVLSYRDGPAGRRRPRSAPASSRSH